MRLAGSENGTDMKRIVLRPEECIDASTIQAAIDAASDAGGEVLLPELDLTIDRGLELRTGVHLYGAGEKTVLRKASGAVYPLTGYHNYGMRDVPLADTEGLEAGMTVSIYDDKRKGFYSSFARISWVDGGWVGLDHGIEADYIADAHPRLVTTYPLVFGHGIRDAGVHDLVLDGNIDENPEPMDGCRGGAVYFARSDAIEISGIREFGYHGEGLSFQMCTNVTVTDCSFNVNSGNGLHPGAGSTGALFERCEARENRRSGFFFCVRANHITVRRCEFVKNTVSGINIGTRDCFNLIDDCTIEANEGPGILFRASSKPIEVHSCRIESCRISTNAATTGKAQIDIEDDTHDIVITGCSIEGSGATPGISVGSRVSRVFVAETGFTAVSDRTSGDGYIDHEPAFECGFESVKPYHRRHLSGIEPTEE